MNNLYNKLSSLELLDKSFHDIYKGKSSKKRLSSFGSDNISLEAFNKKHAYYLNKLHKSLLKKTYKPKLLRPCPLQKQEPGKYRLIAVAAVCDRIVQKTMLDLVYPFLHSYINTEVSYCGVTKNNYWFDESIDSDDSEIYNTKTAFQKVEILVKDQHFFVFKSDIKKFYDNIPKEVILDKIILKFSEYLEDKSLNKIVKGIINFELADKHILSDNPKFHSLIPIPGKGIPQGSPLSQFFANLYLADFDYIMKAKYGDRFIRYIDDFVIFSQTINDANEAETFSFDLIKSFSLELSNDISKTRKANIQRESVTFLGLKISSKGIWCKQTDQELQKWLSDILNFNNYSYKNLKTNSEKINRMNEKILGKANYLRFYHSDQTYKTINKYIQLFKQKSKKNYSKINKLNLANVTPFIKLELWKNYFPNYDSKQDAS